MTAPRCHGSGWRVGNASRPDMHRRAIFEYGGRQVRDVAYIITEKMAAGSRRTDASLTRRLFQLPLEQSTPRRRLPGDRVGQIAPKSTGPFLGASAIADGRREF